MTTLPQELDVLPALRLDATCLDLPQDPGHNRGQGKPVSGLIAEEQPVLDGDVTPLNEIPSPPRKPSDPAARPARLR